MASWLAVVRTQIERMTRVSTTQLAPQPSMMCITIIRLARYLIQAGAPRAPLDTRYQTVFSGGLRLPLKRPYRIDDSVGQQATAGRQR